MSENPGQVDTAKHGETQEFKDKKRKFFVNLGLQTREMLKMHKSAGLWEKDEKGESWENVSEHCLVEVARTEILGELLNLSEDAKKNLKFAAALHDFHKRKDIEATKTALKSKKPVLPVLEKQTEKDFSEMREAGINEDIIYIKEGIGGEKRPESLMLEILDKKDPLPDIDVACLVLHYVDGYTRGDKWAVPAEIVPERGKINELDRRQDKNESNPNYEKINIEGTGFFQEGETMYQAERRICNLIENRIAELLKEKAGIEIDPLDLPEFIDQKIREKIEAIEE